MAAVGHGTLIGHQVTAPLEVAQPQQPSCGGQVNDGCAAAVRNKAIAAEILLTDRNLIVESAVTHQQYRF